MPYRESPRKQTNAVADDLTVRYDTGMPKDPKPENANSPMRKLRRRLSPDPGNPISQARFADMLGISPDTVFSLENGRKHKGMPTEQMAKTILERFGAWWDGELGDWRFASLENEYTRANYELWRSAEFDRQAEISALAKGLAAFLNKVPDSRFAAASDAAYESLHTLARQYMKLEGTDLLLALGGDFVEMDLKVQNVFDKPRGRKKIVGFKRVRGSARPNARPQKGRRPT